MCHPHFHTPADLSPLSYGTGLALGVMLILGLPRAPTASPSTPRAGSPADDPPRATQTSARYRPDLSLVQHPVQRDRAMARR